MKVLVLSGYGINCETETLHAFEVVGFKGKIVHINDLIDNPKQLNDYQVFAFGFPMGTILDQEMPWQKKIFLYDALLNFLRSKDKLIIGFAMDAKGNAMAKKIMNNLYDALLNFESKDK